MKTVFSSIAATWDSRNNLLLIGTGAAAFLVPLLVTAPELFIIVRNESDGSPLISQLALMYSLDLLILIVVLLRAWAVSSATEQKSTIDRKVSR